jgi:hypothetical protein
MHLSFDGIKKRYSPTIMKGRRFFPNDFFSERNPCNRDNDIVQGRALKRGSNLSSVEVIPHFLNAN